MIKFMTKHHFFKYLAILLVCVLTAAIVSLSGCSTLFHSPPPHELPMTDLQKIGKYSSIEIEYVLGRSHYQLQFRTSSEGVETENKIDKKIISRSTVEFGSYIEYLQKTLVFIHQTQEPMNSSSQLPGQPPGQSRPQATSQSSGDLQNCRSPFKVTVQLSRQSYVAHGCRTLDNGNLSKLVKQGEFLVYSKI